MNARTQQIRRTQAGGDTPERLIDAEGERLIIGNMLSRAGFFRRVGPQLTDDCFAIEQYRRVFQLAHQIHESGGDPELSACLRAVLDAGKTTDELGLPQLSALAWNDMVEIANPESWARTLLQKAAARRAWRAAERLRTGMESGFDASDEVAAARDELRAIEGSFGVPTATGATLEDAFTAIGMDVLLSPPRGLIASPWERLNDLTNGGPRPGELWLVGARTGVGKSTVCLQWALKAAAAGQRGLFASLEMPQQDLLKRALSAEADIPHGVLVCGNPEKAWRTRIYETRARIGQHPIEISDKLRTLQAIIAKVAATPDLKLLVVDYLGLVDPGGRFENRNQEVSAISRRLKLAALDYNIPIIAAHQLNRANENENRRPQLSDLRDSGSLEQDADAVLLLDAPGARKRSSDGDKDLIEVLIAKQRNGARGQVIPLRLEGRFCRMIEDQASMAAGGWSR